METESRQTPSFIQTYGFGNPSVLDGLRTSLATLRLLPYPLPGQLHPPVLPPARTPTSDPETVHTSLEVRYTLRPPKRL